MQARNVHTSVAAPCYGMNLNPDHEKTAEWTYGLFAEIETEVQEGRSRGHRITPSSNASDHLMGWCEDARNRGKADQEKGQGIEDPGIREDIDRRPEAE